MSFILEPNNGGDDFVINGWNWRPTVALLERAGVIPNGGRVERCLANGCGGCLSPDEAVRAATILDEFIDSLDSSQRMLHDGSTTDEPIDYDKPISEWTEEDTYNHYSAKYDVLTAFAEFCRISGGFIVH